MTRTIRVTDEDYAIIERNADGRSMAEEIHRMLSGVQITNVTNVTNVTREDYKRLEDAVTKVISNFDYFIKHGQGGIRVYPMEDGKVLDDQSRRQQMLRKVVEGKAGERGFKTALQLQREVRGDPITTGVKVTDEVKVNEVK